MITRVRSSMSGMPYLYRYARHTLCDGICEEHIEHKVCQEYLRHNFCTLAYKNTKQNIMPGISESHGYARHTVCAGIR